MFSGRAKLWGFDFHGGLADRMKGLVSVYKACKELGKEYKVLHTLPYPLEKYLEPNQVNWIIREEDVVYNMNAVSPHWLRHSHYPDENKYHYWRLKKLLNSTRTLHVYSNAIMVSDEEFKSLFHELFKPSFILKNAIEQNLKDIGRKYISLSYRFTHLLGDPIDVYLKELEEDEKLKLIDKAISSIYKMHQLYPEHKLLVNSDSERFLSSVKDCNLNFIYINPGIPVHIDQNFNASDADYLKTFVDFFMISEAEKVFLIIIDEMRNSGFPKCAAMVGNKTFQILNYNSFYL